MRNLNIYKIYKSFYQRSYRDPDDDVAVENTEMIHQWIKALYFANSEVEKRHLLEEGKVLAEVLYDRERSSNVSSYFSLRLKVALASKSWSLEIPNVVLHRWRAEYYQTPGYVYLLTSIEKVGQFKVGATTIPMHKRIATYESRYTTLVSLYKAFPCVNPFQIEREFMDSGLFQRACGNTVDDSIEWYVGRVKEASEVIKGLIACHALDAKS